MPPKVAWLLATECAHSYGTKTLMQNWWRLRSDESATKTLADPSAGWHDRSLNRVAHSNEPAAAFTLNTRTSDTSAKRIGMIARARRRAEQAEHRAQLGCT